MSDLSHYADLLTEIKSRIQTAQSRAVFAVNSELIRLYWHVGNTLNARQSEAGWGAGVIPRLATDIRNELPEIKGFSERNLKRMLAFFRAYPDDDLFVPQAVAQSGTQAVQAMCALPWGHHVLLLERVKDEARRRWYIGIASYEMTRALPSTLQSVLPSIEALEAELASVPQPVHSM